MMTQAQRIFLRAFRRDAKPPRKIPKYIPLADRPGWDGKVIKLKFGEYGREK